MKKLRASLIFILIGAMTGLAIGQVNSGNAEQKSLKEKGLVPIPSQVTPTAPVHAIAPAETGSRTFGLFVPLDGSFTQAYFNEDPWGNPAGYYSDDGSTASFQLPFDFCFYGTILNEFYINLNGNVSFGSGYSEFTSTGFPVAGFPMLAPFWADVDTRTEIGEIWYKVTATHVIVIWDQVGYFQEHGDKRNTFELIFTNGTDPLIGVGNNVAFSFGDMTWTTGDASNGVNGFGGVPATVGVNRGDGIDYALVGRFDHEGTDYDGPDGNYDGVNYLSGKNYFFDACSENVIIGTVPVSNWALLFGIGLILVFALIRMRKIV